jgi:3'(2'), 5'-bisphosphate nucleotidase
MTDCDAAMETDADVEVSQRLAVEAGALLMRVRDAQSSSDEASLGAAADSAAQQFLAEKLADARPADAVLSEEAVDDPGRLTARRVWIIDPLDGTREFSEGREDWAVHVALWSDGDLGAAAVALPGLGTVLSTGQPHPLVAMTGAVRIAVSRTRPPKFAQRVAHHLGGELVPMGSVGFKVAAVVLGKADAYIHAHGQYEWDSAAPVAVARAAGLHASRLDGSDLKYNQPNPYLPDLVVCRPELAGALLLAINEADNLGQLP